MMRLENMCGLYRGKSLTRLNQWSAKTFFFHEIYDNHILNIFWKFEQYLVMCLGILCLVLCFENIIYSIPNIKVWSATLKLLIRIFVTFSPTKSAIIILVTTWLSVDGTWLHRAEHARILVTTWRRLVRSVSCNSWQQRLRQEE